MNKTKDCNKQQNRKLKDIEKESPGNHLNELDVPSSLISKGKIGLTLIF